jgi:hypothetical protein
MQRLPWLVVSNMDCCECEHCRCFASHIPTTKNPGMWSPGAIASIRPFQSSAPGFLYAILKNEVRRAWGPLLPSAPPSLAPLEYCMRFWRAKTVTVIPILFVSVPGWDSPHIHGVPVGQWRVLPGSTQISCDRPSCIAPQANRQAPDLSVVLPHSTRSKEIGYWETAPGSAIWWALQEENSPLFKIFWMGWELTSAIGLSLEFGKVLPGWIG